MHLSSPDELHIVLPKTDAKRVVWLDPEKQLEMREIQTSYLDYSKLRLYPSTEVYIGNQLFFKVNSLGAKGVELDPTLATIGFFGDSVVQCAGPIDSWAHAVRLPGYQSYNGGVEGSPLAPTIDRLMEAASRVAFKAVVLHPGWHNLVYNGCTERYWESQFNRISLDCPLALMTLDPDFAPGVTMSDYIVLANQSADPFHYDDPNCYQIIHNITQGSDHALIEFIAAAERMNTFLRNYCGRRGLPLIDLGSTVRPNRKSELGRKHWDLIHFRTCAFDAVGEVIARALMPLLNAPAPSALQTPAESALRTGMESPPEDLRSSTTSGPGKKREARNQIAGVNYPLW